MDCSYLEEEQKELVRCDAINEAIGRWEENRVEGHGLGHYVSCHYKTVP